MQVFSQNGKEVFVLSSLINAFGVRPDALPLLLADLTEHADLLQNVALTSLMMGKMLNTGDAALPGDQILWMNDPEIPSAERLMVVMSAEPNEGGGFSYGALNMVELQAKRERDGENPLEALLGGGQLGEAGALLGLLGALAEAGEGCGEDDCPACNSQLDEDQTDNGTVAEAENDAPLNTTESETRAVG